LNTVSIRLQPQLASGRLLRPFVMEPGMRWLYNGGATALVARIIAKGTGKRLDAFAREALFDPPRHRADRGADRSHNEPIAASGLRMTPRDLARIGSMMLKCAFRSNVITDSGGR